ncbi:MAG: hypothetical protein ACO1OB_24705 [Archangium sp.]
MAGAGTAFVFRLASDELLIVRGWFDDPLAGDDAVLQLAAEASSSVAEIATLRLESENLAVFWATEDHAALVAELPAGTYRALHEATASGRRLRLTRER